VLEQVTRRLSPDVLLMGSLSGQGSRAVGFTAYRADDVGFRDRETLALAEHDDEALTAYVEGRERPVCDLRRDLAAQTAAGLLHPVYAGSAATGAGVGDLMSGIADLLPVPEPDPDLPPSGRVFKIERGTAGEKVAYVRVFTGAIGVRQRLDLPDGRVGKVAGVQRFEGGQWVRAAEVGAGQIGRLHGLAPVRVGDVFGVLDAAADLHFAPPTLEASVAAVRPEQGPALRAALAALADQDPLIDARGEQEGSVVVSLYGRVQQEVLAATLAEEYGIETTWADARVLHVERPRRTATALEALNTPSNPWGATVGLRITPTPPGSGVTFELDVPARGIPLFLYKSAEAFAAVMERHVLRTFEHGLRGWRVTDCRVTLTEVGYASWDGPPSTRGNLPTALDYRKLTPLVLRQALARAGTRVCEPVLHVSLEVPTETTTALQRLLGRWGAELTDQASRGDLATLEARLPAARLHELQRQLPDLTGGEGVLESRFDGYQPVRGPAPTRDVAG
jgi:ribosomal protection tetracycline resistance protein